MPNGDADAEVRRRAAGDVRPRVRPAAVLLPLRGLLVAAVALVAFAAVLAPLADVALADAALAGAARPAAARGVEPRAAEFPRPRLACDVRPAMFTP